MRKIYLQMLLKIEDIIETYLHTAHSMQRYG